MTARFEVDAKPGAVVAYFTTERTEHTENIPSR